MIRLLVVLAAVACAGNALAAEITAWVDAVSGQKVTMIVEGPLDPSPGDRFEIRTSGFSRAGVFRSHGVITDVDPGTARAHGELGDGQQTPWVGLEVMIDSASPVTRITAANDPWLSAIGDIEGLSLAAGEPFYRETGTGNDSERTLALVREWIAVAEPPRNAEPGYQLTYTRWAQVQGITPTGRITVNAKPDDAGGASYDEYLWSRHRELDSLNHCTLREYVEARLASRGIEHCRSDASLTSRPPTATPSSDSASPQPHSRQPVAVREGVDDDARPSLTAHAAITGTIEPRADRDEFVFDAPHHGEWRFSVVESPPGVTLKLGVYPAPAGNWLPDVDSRDDLGIVVDLAAPGAYIVRVSGANGGMSSASAYRVVARFVASADVFEPNNDTESARVVEGSGEIVGTILPRADRDHYVFESERHGQWDVHVAERPDEVDVRVGVYPYPNGNWLPDMAGDEADRLVVDLPAPGKYVLRATGANGGMRSIGRYRLETTFTPSADVFEPNNDTESARVVEGSGEIVGTILPRADRDRYRIATTGATILQVQTVDSPPGVDLNIGVFRAPNGNWLRDEAPDRDDLLVVRLSEAGEWILNVAGRNGGMRSVLPYRLRLSTP